MDFKLKLLLGTSLIGFLTHAEIALAEEAVDSVGIVETIETSETTIDSQRYIVQSGDTIDVVAEEVALPVHLLEEVEAIVPFDLMTPETELESTFGVDHTPVTLTVVTIGGVEYVFELLSGTAVLVEETQEVETSTYSVSNEEKPAKEPIKSNNTLGNLQLTEVVDAQETVKDETSEKDMTDSTPEKSETEAPEEPETETSEEPKTETPEKEKPELTPETSENDMPELESEVSEDDKPESDTPEDSASQLELDMPETDTSATLETFEAEVSVPENTVTPEATEEVIQPEEVPPADSEYLNDPLANPENAGLQYKAAYFKEKVGSMYGIEDYSLYRAGDSQDHGQGLAVDLMTYDNAALGDEIANYSINNMSEYDISYVIWQQEIYGDWNHEWVGMEDRGSITANHYDHVHVSFNQ